MGLGIPGVCRCECRHRRWLPPSVQSTGQACDAALRKCLRRLSLPPTGDHHFSDSSARGGCPAAPESGTADRSRGVRNVFLRGACLSPDSAAATDSLNDVPLSLRLTLRTLLPTLVISVVLRAH